MNIDPSPPPPPPNKPCATKDDIIRLFYLFLRFRNDVGAANKRGETYKYFFNNNAINLAYLEILRISVGLIPDFRKTLVANYSDTLVDIENLESPGVTKTNEDVRAIMNGVCIRFNGIDGIVDDLEWFIETQLLLLDYIFLKMEVAGPEMGLKLSFNPVKAVIVDENVGVE